MTTQTLTEPPAYGNQSGSRITRLSSQVGQLRTKAASGNLDRYLLVVGGILMPLGVVFIILGWAGASRTPLPFEQNDYLISGGLLGLALVVAGGFTYFAYWQTVRIRESRDQSRELTDAIRRVEKLLSGGGPAVAAAGVVIAAPTFVATANGSMFHRPDCAAVAGREDLVAVDAANTSLRPCRICSPLDDA
jgi:hypothetical protein